MRFAVAGLNLIQKILPRSIGGGTLKEAGNRMSRADNMRQTWQNKVLFAFLLRGGRANGSHHQAILTFCNPTFR
jgi:hypothetical protein